MKLRQRQKQEFIVKLWVNKPVLNNQIYHIYQCCHSEFHSFIHIKGALSYYCDISLHSVLIQNAFRTENSHKRQQIKISVFLCNAES